jgi:hypothetical protein
VVGQARLDGFRIQPTGQQRWKPTLLEAGRQRWERPGSRASEACPAGAGAAGEGARRLSCGGAGGPSSSGLGGQSGGAGASGGDTGRPSCGGAGAAARSGGRASCGGAVERPTTGVAIPAAGEGLGPGGCGIHGVVGKMG